MNNNFQNNLKKLAGRFSQKYIAEKTGFSQSSINNYLTKNIYVLNNFNDSLY